MNVVGKPQRPVRAGRRFRPLPAAPLYRRGRRQGELEIHADAYRTRWHRRKARRQPQGGAVPCRRAGEAGTGRQRHGKPQPARPRLRQDARHAARRNPAPAQDQTGNRRGVARRSAVSAGGADRRRRRSHQTAGASAARRRRRALHLLVDRLRDRSEDRLHQRRPAPHDAARPPRGRHRPCCAERSARDLRGDRSAGQAAAGQLRGRRASDRSCRRGDAAADRRTRPRRLAARRAAAGGEVRDQRHPRAG